MYSPLIAAAGITTSTTTTTTTTQPGKCCIQRATLHETYNLLGGFFGVDISHEH